MKEERVERKLRICLIHVDDSKSLSRILLPQKPNFSFTSLKVEIHSVHRHAHMSLQYCMHNM